MLIPCLQLIGIFGLMRSKVEVDDMSKDYSQSVGQSVKRWFPSSKSDDHLLCESSMEEVEITTSTSLAASLIGEPKLRRRLRTGFVCGPWSPKTKPAIPPRTDAGSCENRVQLDIR